MGKGIEKTPFFKSKDGTKFNISGAGRAAKSKTNVNIMNKGKSRR